MKKLLSKLWLWQCSYGFALGTTAYLSVRKRRRMSHNNGVTATGRIKIVDNPTFPENDFLRPGRVFPCRLRHAAVSYPDEAALQVFGTSLKFSDNVDVSPFDLELNTGTISIFWSAKTFLELGLFKFERGWWTFLPYYLLHPRGYEAARNNVRWLPESYAWMWYHSQTVSKFVDTAGRLYYARYRLVPEDYQTRPETGIPPKEKLEFPHVANAQPPDRERPDRDYLKDEYRNRVQHHAPVRYHLQLQLHAVQPDDSPEWCNSNKEWDEATHPWMELARVEIDKIWDWDDAVRTRTWINHAPKSLGILPSSSWNDYNSVNYMRSKSRMIGRIRVLANRLWGTKPRPTPERRVGTNNPYY